MAGIWRWDQSVAYYIDKNPHIHPFLKNAGLGLAIPYIRDNEPHDRERGFIIPPQTDSEKYLILETKGYDPYEESKMAAAQRWVNMVNADGEHAQLQYRIARYVTTFGAAVYEAGFVKRDIG